MNWRKWKIGLASAVACGVLTACAGLTGDMGWRSFVAVLAASLLTNLGNYLVKHPVESVNDGPVAIRTGGATDGTDGTDKTKL